MKFKVETSALENANQPPSFIPYLTTRQIISQRRLLGRIDAEGVVVFDLDPGADVCAFVACERGHPFGGVCGRMCE